MKYFHCPKLAKNWSKHKTAILDTLTENNSPAESFWTNFCTLELQTKIGREIIIKATKNRYYHQLNINYILLITYTLIEINEVGGNGGW